jgi:hypothetical protein
MRFSESIRRASAELFVWLLPALVVVEYVGTTLGNTLATSAGVLAVFLGALWLAPPDEARASRVDRPRSRWLIWAGRVVGLAATGAGLWFMARSLLPLLEPGRFPMPPLGTQSQRELFLWAPVLAAYPAALGLRVLRGRWSGRDVERLGLLIALALLVHQIGKLRVQSLPVLPYARPGLDAITLTAAGVLLLLLVVPRVPTFVRMLALLGVGLGLRFVGLETWKLDPITRDMLPLVKSAQDAFLSGANPYGLHQMQPGSVVPLTYLPGMWLVWLVPRLFGVADFRVMGLVADAAVVLGLYFTARGVRAPLRERAEGAAMAFSAVWLLSPSLAWNGIYAEPHAWWLVLALLLAATLRRRWWLVALLLGLALATRHFALVVAPFVVVALVRDQGPRAALPKLALSGLVTAALLFPFVWRNPDAFWFGTYRWLVDYGPAHQTWFWERLGFSGAFYKSQSTEWLPRAQLAAVGAFLLGALFVRGRRAFIASAGSAYVLFVMLNGIIWDSFYLGCALFAAFAAAGGHAPDRPSSSPRRPTKRALVLATLGLAVSLATGGYLVWSFVVSQRQVGRVALREHLARTLSPTDALVDRADWNLAFVHAKPLFAASAPPAPTARDALDQGLGPFGAFSHPRAWFVLRSGRENDLLRELRALGTPVEDRRFGVYRVLGVDGLQVAGGLSGSPSSVPPRPCRLGGAVRLMTPLAPARRAPTAANFRSTLGRRLVVVGGFDDPGVRWDRRRARAFVRVDGALIGSLRLPNLPGAQLAVLDTTAITSGEHDVEISVITRDGNPRTVCVDGWILR